MRLLCNIIIILVIILKNSFISINLNYAYLPDFVLLLIYVIYSLDHNLIRFIDLIILSFFQDLLAYGIPGISFIQNFLCVFYAQKISHTYQINNLLIKWLNFTFFIILFIPFKYTIQSLITGFDMPTLTAIVKQIFFTILSLPIVYYHISVLLHKRKKLNA